MLRSSGATGAGPLFRAVMEAALREAAPGGALAPRAPPVNGPSPAAVVVCAASGQLAAPACPHRLALQGSAAPRETCTWHRQRCPAEKPGAAGCRASETLPGRYAAWALASGRADEVEVAEVVGARTGQPPPRIIVPGAGQRFALDSHVSRAQQELVLRAEAELGERVRFEVDGTLFEVDGTLLCVVGAPFACVWPLSPGVHRLEIAAGGQRRSRTFRVE
jgi:hypothetical protein